jgi:folate-binding protein YgfZ
MAIARLADRTIVQVTGPEARPFLDRLVTCDMDRVSVGRARFGALLSPQGKLLADFIAMQPDETGETFWLDCPRAASGDLARRLTMYKLRAKVSVAALPDASVLAGWDDAAVPAGSVNITDPRLAALGWRAVLTGAGETPGFDDAGEGAYEAHRVALGIPESGRDFAFGDAFAHEALMDQLGGVDFDKGCYVGQEIVSRMQHRGTARTRVVALAWQPGLALAHGAEIKAGDRVLGTVASVSGDRGLGMIRVDRAADALAAGTAIEAGGVGLRFEKPDWVRFPYPDEITAPVV